MTLLYSFPSEILTLIIEFLDQRDVYQSLFVNKRFYKAAIPTLRRSRWIINQNTTIRNNDQLSLVGQHIRTITLTHFVTLSDIDFLMLVNYTHLLEELIVPFTARIPMTCIQQLPLLCPNFKSLHLGNPYDNSLACLNCMGRRHDTLSCIPLQYHRYPLDLDTPTLSALVEFPSLLDQFSIVHPPPQMLAQMTHRPHVVAMELSHFHRLTHLTLYFIPQELFALIFISDNNNQAEQKWPMLKKLSVAGDIVQDPIISFIQSHPQLLALVLVHCAFMDNHLFAIARMAHPGLTNVTIKDNKSRPYISKYALKCLIECTPRLSHVLFDGRKLAMDTLGDADPKGSLFRFR